MPQERGAGPLPVPAGRAAQPKTEPRALTLTQEAGRQKPELPQAGRAEALPTCVSVQGLSRHGDLAPTRVLPPDGATNAMPGTTEEQDAQERSSRL